MDSIELSRTIEWIDARREFVAREKHFTRLRDELSQQRRDLPWERVEKAYVFDGPNGRESLGDLFAGKSQLIVYHFMFAPDWEEGCKSCSFWADNFERPPVHLKHRDIDAWSPSRARRSRSWRPTRKRLGWTFKWVSSGGNDFNYDYHVSFTPEEVEQGEAQLQLRQRRTHAGAEMPGVSVFYKDAVGHDLPHLFELFARDRHDEQCLPLSRSDAEGPRRGRRHHAWLRRNDEYTD